MVGSIRATMYIEHSFVWENGKKAKIMKIFSIFEQEKWFSSLKVVSSNAQAISRQNISIHTRKCMCVCSMKLILPFEILLYIFFFLLLRSFAALQHSATNARRLHKTSQLIYVEWFAT